MRWKLLRRRLSISAPRMIVRSYLPWPLRWAVAALMLGFSAALGLWAFDVGRGWAGLEMPRKMGDAPNLRDELQVLRGERDKAWAIANTAESLLKAERAAQAQLIEQLKAVEAENMRLKADLGFFERLLPAQSDQAVSIRGLQVEVMAPGQLRIQLLVMQPGKSLPEFQGSYDIILAGMFDGKPWAQPAPGGARPLQVKRHLRIDDSVEHPVPAVVKTIQVRLMDARGVVQAVQTAKL